MSEFEMKKVQKKLLVFLWNVYSYENNMNDVRNSGGLIIWRPWDKEDSIFFLNSVLVD